MKPPLSTLSALVLLCACGTAGAAPAEPTAAPHGAASQPSTRYPEPVVRHLVTQDRAVRIQEQQVRGATTSIEVQPLHGGAAYSVVPPQAAAPGPDSMQGRMQWHIGTFR